MADDRKLSLSWRGVGVPKHGHADEEYEDAYAAAPRAGRFAVADGASESSFASLWARLLVDEFVGRPPSPGDWLAPLRRRWAEEVDGRPLPWYAEAKRADGAFAAFLGLVLRGGRDASGAGRWRALAVGDCCLFQVRRDGLAAAFPVPHSSDFGNRPDLLGSRPPGKLAPRPRSLRSQGDWQMGDRFFLATDALAEWFLRRHEEGLKPWQELEPLLSGSRAAATFAEWARKSRAGGSLRNDDIALLRVAVGERSSLGPPDAEERGPAAGPTPSSAPADPGPSECA